MIFPLTPARMPNISKTNAIHAGTGKGKSHPLMMLMQTCTATIEISGSFPREAGIGLPQDPSMPLI